MLAAMRRAPSRVSSFALTGARLFLEMISGAGRELVRRVIALDPMIDQALGESSHVRYRSSILQSAVHGLFRALDGWRGVARHLRSISDRHHRRLCRRACPLVAISVLARPIMRVAKIGSRAVLAQRGAAVVIASSSCDVVMSQGGTRSCYSLDRSSMASRRAVGGKSRRHE